MIMLDITELFGASSSAYTYVLLNGASNTSYKKNIRVFNNVLKKLLKFPYYKLGK